MQIRDKRVLRVLYSNFIIRTSPYHPTPRTTAHSGKFTSSSWGPGGGERGKRAREQGIDREGEIPKWRFPCPTTFTNNTLFQRISFEREGKW